MDDVVVVRCYVEQVSSVQSSSVLLICVLYSVFLIH